MPRCSSWSGGTSAYIKQRENYGDSKLSTRYLREKLANAKGWQCTDLKGHFGCVNALEFSDDGCQITSGGDDRRILLWNVEKALADKGAPVSMRGQHNSNIFCLAFTLGNRRILSGGNDAQVLLHDAQSGRVLDAFQHEEAVYCLSAHPDKDNVFASAGDDGRALVYDLRQPSSDPYELTRPGDPMHGIMFNPVDPQYIATINASEGPSLWDIRQNRQPVEKYMYSLRQGNNYSGMSVRFNSSGDRLVAIGRKMPPVVYDVSKRRPLHCFDADGYYNACTIKSCCFAGDKDQYIVSGSDNFRIYIWRVPDYAALENKWIGTPFAVLTGHRSIVNQVRFNGTGRCLFISSGVEKVIKAWSPLGLKSDAAEGSSASDHTGLERRVYTHEEYIDLVLRSGHFMAHDYSEQSVNEDPRMIAFFDSLVQRELEDNSTSSSSSGSAHILHVMASSASSSSSSSRSPSPQPGIGAADSLLARRASSSSSEQSSHHDRDHEADDDDSDDESASGRDGAVDELLARPSGRYSPFTCAFFSRVMAPATAASNVTTSTPARTDVASSNVRCRTMSDLIAHKRATYVRSLTEQNGAHVPTQAVGSSGGFAGASAAREGSWSHISEREASRLDRRRSRIVQKLRRIRARLMAGVSSSSSSSSSPSSSLFSSSERQSSDTSGRGPSGLIQGDSGDSSDGQSPVSRRRQHLSALDAQAELGQQSPSGDVASTSADSRPVAAQRPPCDGSSDREQPRPSCSSSRSESDGSGGIGSIGRSASVEFRCAKPSPAADALGDGSSEASPEERDSEAGPAAVANGDAAGPADAGGMQPDARRDEANGDERGGEADRSAVYFRKHESLCNRRRQYRSREEAVD